MVQRYNNKILFLGNIYDLDLIIFTLILTLLASDSISPSIADNSDDFPEPTEPTTATSDPSGIFKLILNVTNGIGGIDDHHCLNLYI